MVAKYRFVTIYGKLVKNFGVYALVLNSRLLQTSLRHIRLWSNWNSTLAETVVSGVHSAISRSCLIRDARGQTSFVRGFFTRGVPSAAGVRVPGLASSG